MATTSTPARSRHATEEDAAIFSRPFSRAASPKLNDTVRYPPPDPLHVFSLGKARDAPSLTAVARQIAASRAPHSAPASQSLSFVALRASQAGSTSELAGRAAPRSRRPSPSPTRTHSSRSSSRAEPGGGVILQTLARFAEQLAAQSAAQSAAQLAALSTVMQRFETLHPATPPRRSRRPERQPAPASRSPSRRASPSQRSSHRQTALVVNARQGAPLPFAARPLAQDPRATAHQLAISTRIAFPVPLSAAQQSHQLVPPPLGRFVCASPRSLEPLVPSASLVSALLAQSTNLAESPQSGLLLAPLAFPSLSLALPSSLPSLIQYAPQYLQSALRVASTVVVPATPQPSTTSALFASAPRQFEAAAEQPASQVGAPLSVGVQSLQFGAPLSVGA